MKICILGTGIYSLALAIEFAKKKNQIMMWSENPDLVEKFHQNHNLNSIYKIKIPNNINVTNSYAEALKNADLVVFACASKFVDIVAQNIKPYFKASMHVCIATKGIEESTEKLLSTIINETLKTKNIAVISGPSFATDMLEGNPIALAIASTKKSTQKLVMNLLANEKLKLRPTKDIIGVQICGSIKNCIAIASGIINGLGYPESTQSFLINESLHDIKEIIYHLGGKPKTILSFAGVGDIMLTCMSTKSRNFSLGYIIGSSKDSKKVKEYLATTTVEGYYALDVIYKLLKHQNINIPLIDTIYNIVYNEENPEQLITFLINKK